MLFAAFVVFTGISVMLQFISQNIYGWEALVGGDGSRGDASGGGGLLLPLLVFSHFSRSLLLPRPLSQDRLQELWSGRKRK